MKQREETFFGYYIKEELYVAISVKVIDNIVDINRLSLQPEHFRLGIAQKLFTFIKSPLDTENIKIAPGSNNIPAVTFYKKNGFQMIKEVRLNDHLSLTIMRRN